MSDVAGSPASKAPGGLGMRGIRTVRVGGVQVAEEAFAGMLVEPAQELRVQLGGGRVDARPGRVLRQVAVDIEAASEAEPVTDVDVGDDTGGAKPRGVQPLRQRGDARRDGVFECDRAVPPGILAGEDRRGGWARPG